VHQGTLPSHLTSATVANWFITLLMPVGAQAGLQPEQLRYTLCGVINSFAHKGLQAFFTTGSKAGIQPAHAARLRRQLAQLDRSSEPRDMSVPGWNLHPLKGDQAGHWSVWVSGNWRLTFKFDGTNAVIENYQDYH
jgi:proteic killer suppression protein